MKVGTDSVLLGSWSDSADGGSILDIGSGSGLIAIMSAQKNPNSLIDAVEIELNSAIQAKENVSNCPWSDRIKIHHDSFQNFSKQKNKYKLIISNPPYFNSSLLPNAKGRSLARHTLSLTHEELLQGVYKLLDPSGIFSVIIPYDSLDSFTQKASESRLFIKKTCLVYPTAQSEPKRALLEFSHCNNYGLLVSEKIIIEEFGRHKYSEKYISLTEDFYLYTKVKIKAP